MSLGVAIIIAIIIGALVGLSIGIGTARMFHAPEKQALGAFRTLGEINACNGDPVSHFAFGLGFFLTQLLPQLERGRWPKMLFIELFLTEELLWQKYVREKKIPFKWCAPH